MFIGMPVLYEYNSVEENMILAKKLNVDFLEMNLNFSYCREALENPQELKALMEKYNVMITLHFYDEADFGTYPEVADAYLGLMEHYLKLGAQVGLKQMNVHLIEGPVVTISGVKNYIYNKEFDTYIKRLNTYFKKVDDLCKSYNVQLVIENSKIVPYMERTYEFLINEGYIFTWDIGHDECNGNIVKAVYDKHDMHFKEFHIHDSNGTKDHLSLGDGNINIKFFKDLAIKEEAFALLEVKSSEDLIASVPYFRNL